MRGFVAAIPQDVRVSGAENTFAPAVVNLHFNFGHAGIWHKRGEEFVNAIPVRSEDIGKVVVKAFEHVNAYGIGEFRDVSVAVGHAHGIAAD